MQFSGPIFLAMLCVGVATAAAAVIIRRWLQPRRAAAACGGTHDRAHLRQTVGQLYELVSALSADVDAHQAELDGADRGLGSARQQDPGQMLQLTLDTLGRLVSANDVLQTRLAAAEQTLQFQAAEITSHVAAARTDPLTHLANRRVFDDTLATLLAEWRQRKTPLCLILADLDHFKRLNDRYGHLAGDQALRQVAAALRPLVAASGVAARIGGEEFAFLLPQTAAAAAQRQAEAVRAAVAQCEYAIEGGTLRLTASVGATVALPGDTPATLIRRADEALYKAKRSGRDCGYFHDGQACTRIEPPEAEFSRLTELCDALRHRVAEVAG